MSGGRHRGHNEGSYYRLPNGRWRAQVTVSGRRLSANRDTRQAAIDWIRETLGQVKKGMTFQGAQVTFGEFTDYYLVSTQGARKKKTWKYYKWSADKYILPTLGEIRLKDLRPEHIQGLYNDLLAQGKTAWTVQKTHVVIHLICSHAEDLGLIPFDPTEKVIPPRPPDEEMQILDESQISQLLLAVKGTWYEALVYIAVTTGMRIGELLGLKWDDIDWGAKTIRVERQLENITREFGSPKTRYGRRVIALGDRALDVLRAHRELQDLMRAAQGSRWQENGLVFPGIYGKPKIYHGLHRDFQAILKRVGLPPIRFHDLRHTAASMMLNHGIPVLVVSRRLGHSKPSITLNVYGHLIPGFQEEAADLMDDLVSPVEIIDAVST